MVAKSPAVQRKNASAAKRNITRTVSSVANTLGPKETMNVAGKFSGHIQIDPDLYLRTPESVQESNDFRNTVGQILILNG